MYHSRQFQVQAILNVLEKSAFWIENQSNSDIWEFLTYIRFFFSSLSFHLQLLLFKRFRYNNVPISRHKYSYTLVTYISSNCWSFWNIYTEMTLKSSVTHNETSGNLSTGKMYLFVLYVWQSQFIRCTLQIAGGLFHLFHYLHGLEAWCMRREREGGSVLAEDSSRRNSKRVAQAGVQRRCTACRWQVIGCGPKRECDVTPRLMTRLVWPGRRPVNSCLYRPAGHKPTEGW